MTTPTSIFSETQRPNEEWLARAAPEAALEPDLPIIDPHLHFWHHKSGYRYFVEEFARDAAESGHNIEGTVFVECNAMYRASGPEHLKPVGETEFAVGMAALAASGKYTQARAAAGIVAYADLTMDPGLLRETLEAHREAANGRLRGIRQRAKWDADPVIAGPVRAGKRELFLDADFRRGLAEVTKTEAPAPVLGTELVALPLGEIREAAAVCAGEVDRSRDRHVGAEAGQRLEDGGLGAVEPGRERVYGDDEADSNGQPERGEDCAAAPPPELRKHVGHVEHSPERNSAN